MIPQCPRCLILMQFSTEEEEKNSPLFNTTSDELTVKIYSIYRCPKCNFQTSVFSHYE